MSGYADWPTGPAKRPAVLLATNHLSGWTGSETLLLTLVEGLRAAGCALAVYARHLDRDWFVRQVGDDIPVADDPVALRGRRFDLAHVQHSTCLVDVRAAFPSLPIVFSSLGVLPFLEQPPPIDCGISRYLAISEEVRANLVAQGVPADRIDIVRNLVSELRFAPTEPIRSRPERILVLSYRMDEARRGRLRSAARLVGASTRFVGGSNGSLSQHQLAVAINAADVVVSLGRGAVEAMLCGRVPLVFDIHGGDGLVTPDNLDELGSRNFSGRCHRREYTIRDLAAEFGKYRAEFGPRLRERAMERFGLAANIPRLLDHYAAAVKARAAPPADQIEACAFCSTLAREDLMRSRQHQSRAAELQRELHRVKHTISWRITKPIRLLANLPRHLHTLFSRSEADR